MKLLFALATIVFLSISQGVSSERPNIVFINADDLTHTDLSVYGGQAKTPNFDRLAQEGMLFKNCFQAAPMCSPTRHNLYTGLYPVKSGAYPNHTFAKEGTKSIVQFLRPHGYRVALSGKTHVAPKEVFPFEYSGGKNPDMDAIDQLMAESKEAGTPFCLFACSNEPHTPWTYGDASEYPPEKIELPAYFVDTPATRRGMSKYLAEISYYDSQVGQILDLLDEHELANNTIVMVSSEQGSSMPFAKWTLYDPGLQTALIVRWPGVVEPGSSNDALVEYVDVVPTLLDAAKIEIPDGLDGLSFLSVLKNEASEHKDYVYGIMTTRGINNGPEHFGIRSIRSKTHHLIVNLTPEIKVTNACTESEEFQSWERKSKSGKKRAAKLVEKYRYRPPVELYEVQDGWHNWANLADSPDHSDILRDLRGRLDAWMEAQGDEGQATEMAAMEHQTRSRKKGSKEAEKK